MKMCAAAVFNGKIAHIIQIRADQPVLGQPKTVAGIGLREIARRGVGKMHVPGITDEIQRGQPVALRIGRRLTARGSADGGQDRLKRPRHGVVAERYSPSCTYGL